jgi:hypothetical protein
MIADAISKLILDKAKAQTLTEQEKLYIETINRENLRHFGPIKPDVRMRRTEK